MCSRAEGRPGSPKRTGDNERSAERKISRFQRQMQSEAEGTPEVTLAPAPRSNMCRHGRSSAMDLTRASKSKLSPSTRLLEDGTGDSASPSVVLKRSSSASRESESSARVSDRLSS